MAPKKITSIPNPNPSGNSIKGELPSMVRALQHRNFQLFFGGQLISLIGTWMQSVAQSWLVYRLTNSAVLLGLVGFSSQIPVFLLAPWGGVVADRLNRRKILVATQTIAMVLAFVLAVLTLTQRIHVWHLFVLSALLGLANAFDIPTRQAFVVDMVGKEDLINAIALNSSMVNGARVVGPAIAGLLVAAVGEGWCFLLNAISYIAVIAGLIAMNVRGHAPAASRRSTLEHIAEGFSFVAKNAPVRALLLLLGLVSLMGMPYAVLMPIFADRILHGGAGGLGILMGASGVGALIGALTLAARRGIRGLGRWVAISSAAFGLCLILFSLSRHFWLSAILLVPVGFFFMFEMSASNTLVQSMVTDNLRGRVMAVYSMMFMGMAPVGALIAGGLAEPLGAPKTLAIGGAVCIVGGGIFALRLPALRHEARKLLVSLEMAGGNPPDEMTSEHLSRS
ncbi:MAG: MFS transporter [Pyrinomonadaceae bacterium]